MALAYVLITCDLGYEEEVLSHLKGISCIKEATGTFGAYDILVRIEDVNEKSLRDTITQHIRKSPKIRSTLTLSVIESQD